MFVYFYGYIETSLLCFKDATGVTSLHSFLTQQTLQCVFIFIGIIEKSLLCFKDATGMTSLHSFLTPNS